jgi:DNA-binding NarL/FixJ family response regulator
MIDVLICDDQAIARHGLQMILSTAPEMRIVGEAQDGEEAIARVAALQPHLVLMDLKMPKLNGVEATRAIRAQFPHVYVLVLTTYDADEWVFEAVRAGAHGYLLKDTPPAQLLGAIRGTVEGKTAVDPGVAGKLLASVASLPPPLAPGPEVLSAREVAVLRLMAEGLTNAEIGLRLHLSEGTVRNYASAILGKLGARDRTQAVVMGIRMGVIRA